MASQWKRCLQLINVKRKCWCQSGLRSRSLIPNNTASWSRICLSDSGCPIGSFFTSHSLNGYSCGDGTISFETFVEREISCCAPWLPVILTSKFHSLGVMESEILPPTPQPWCQCTWKMFAMKCDCGSFLYSTCTKPVSLLILSFATECNSNLLQDRVAINIRLKVENTRQCTGQILITWQDWFFTHRQGSWK